MEKDTTQLTDPNYTTLLYPFTRVTEVIVEEGKMLNVTLDEINLRIKNLEDKLKALEES